MKHSSFARLMLGGGGAALLVLSAAAPAEARPRGWGYPRHHDGIDGGDLLLGAILAGGAILLATNIAKDRDRDRPRDGRWDGSRDDGNRADSEREAADLCADAAEREVPRRWSQVRARVDEVQRNGDTTYVRGVVSGEDQEHWSDRNRAEASSFRCAVRFGRIENLSLDREMAWR